MIKAEVISHEGNPGPNWLDHCRTIATPINITVVLLLVIVGSLFIGITRHNATSSANQQSTPGPGQASVQPQATSLLVQPLQAETSTSNGSTTVQSATGGQGPVTNPNTQDASGSALGAAKTPALNSSNNGRKAQQTPVNNRAQQSLQQLQGQLQSTVQTTTRGVNDALSGLFGR